MCYTSQLSPNCNKNMILDILGQASDCYWKILAERARTKLDDQIQENRQVEDKRVVCQSKFLLSSFTNYSKS